MTDETTAAKGCLKPDPPLPPDGGGLRERDSQLAAAAPDETRDGPTSYETQELIAVAGGGQ